MKTYQITITKPQSQPYSALVSAKNGCDAIAKFVLTTNCERARIVAKPEGKLS